jgi:alpha-glucoside transport system permease protein
VHVFLVLICALWLVPVLALLVSSFRPAFDIATTGWWRTAQTGNLSLTNYGRVLSAGGLATAFGNSLLIAVPAVSVLTCVGSVAAFALARMPFRGRGLVVGALLALLVLPVQMTLVPVLRLYNTLGLTGTFVGIWLAHIGFALPFAVYLLRNFFAALPRELFEAAVVDGAEHTTAFLRLALPLARPAIASVAIFQLIWIWNDLLIALIFLGGDPSVAPLTVVVSNLVSSTTGEGWELLTAAAFVSMAFPMLVFAALQRFFVRGLLAGSVK